MAETQRPRSAIIVGAGAGGIAVAARLAKAGVDVTVLEKNDFTGGRCSLIHTKAGYRFDQGPSLLLLPGLFRETFEDLGTTLEQEDVELLQCFPNYNIWFSDGKRFSPTTDNATMKVEIEKWEGPDGFRRYLSWLAEGHQHYETSLRHVLHRNFKSILELADPRLVVTLLMALHPFESIWHRAGRYFKTDRMQRVFTFATMYMGMSPFDAPATYSLLQYSELAEGIWYPRGGFHKVLDALVKIGERMGVKYRLNTGVSQVLTDGGKNGKKPKATGVQLENGEVLNADLVVVNADLVYTYNNLLPKEIGGIKKYANKLNNRKASCSSISFYWSLSGMAKELETHNIFLAEEYKESFDAIFERQALPDDPSFYIHVPSRVDPSAAPPDRDAVIALVPVGHLLQNGQPELDWPTLVSKARAGVLATIQARTGLSLSPLITEEIVNTPYTWETKFNLSKGAILGLAHDFFNVLAFRPRTKAQGMDNAYFVGASTHPGTGVPIVLAGAKITAEQILEETFPKNTKVPWTTNEERNSERMRKEMDEKITEEGIIMRSNSSKPGRRGSDAFEGAMEVVNLLSQRAFPLLVALMGVLYFLLFVR
ncbi:Phytoene dehydrogenase [Neurospora crassa]|uniref:Phytoene desaturase n=1 Tax=Neurospora crassa (strain ATCC 24698 / 74-OR23-1A / CBS 708.71 / DSM 1257 / FGSC 987) TaxID=367110 RepID=CRTI_NEUCR|nr:phytoene desaturase [Neurospora crassa OR74A]P21334.1 RecName: Full=Phytoene desaturase; AltName: Full=Albino-1 protein; AltName: Full=Phytoene desaturase (3,4-didehydrolycopene-forming); Flags: Precursor [Neurospora crassa OR74A]AAA33555.1 phytoene dehydrogenase [Neurospora crassa]EAA35477.1 phytoene desaturase [Neurospora crassa OR74A]KHE85138.1 Phytoene dehydrogenase [Neurospora crassa]|eukprot:XP_964713.1 phytoene desaturase [Neurospora crassa OR74A]